LNKRVIKEDEVMWTLLGIVMFFVVYFMTATKLTKRWLAERRYKAYLEELRKEKSSGN